MFDGLTELQADIFALEFKGKNVSQISRMLKVPERMILEKRQEALDSVHKDGADLQRVVLEAKKHATFRRIFGRALDHEGIQDLDQMAEFTKWAIGDDYQMLPYEQWPDRIKARTRLIVDGSMSVYEVIRAAAQVFKRKKVIVGMN